MNRRSASAASRSLSILSLSSEIARSPPSLDSRAAALWSSIQLIPLYLQNLGADTGRAVLAIFESYLAAENLTDQFFDRWRLLGGNVAQDRIEAVVQPCIHIAHRYESDAR